jgi:hypothetical protein
MAHATLTTGSTQPTLAHTDPAAGDAGRWPTDTRTAHRDLSRQLDAWCRANDWPSVLNAWIAEEAIRRC